MILESIREQVKKINKSLIHSKKHFKIVEKLIDIALNHGGKEVVKTIERYEAKEEI